MTCHIFRDPSLQVDGLRKAERRERELLAGTGCDTCQHGEWAFGAYHCMKNQKHPVCVFKKIYVERLG